MRTRRRLERRTGSAGLSLIFALSALSVLPRREGVSLAAPAYRTHAARPGSAYGAWSVDCATCHTLHAGTTSNVHLIREVIQTPNSGAKSVPFRFDDVTGGTNPGDQPGDNPARLSFLGDRSGSDNAPYDDGICEVCHTQTQHHRNSAGGDHAHNAGIRCVNCHRHERGFFADPNDCLGCHSVPQGARRSVARDFGMARSHPLHYDRGALTSPEGNDCLVCHLERVGGANHRDGVVDFSPDPDGSGGSEWNDGTGKSWFCLDCHDAASPGHLASRTASDKSMLYESSHVKRPDPAGTWSVAPRKCGYCHLGDPNYPTGGPWYGRELFPFYGNVHRPAVANPKLRLSRPDRPEPTFTEENVCYACHGAYMNSRRYGVTECGAPPNDRTYMEPVALTMGRVGVTSDADVPFFPIVSRHLAADPCDGKNMCRTCHDPHQLGRYAYNASGSIIFDPQSPETPWPWSGNGTTPDGFCARCHDGTAAAPPVHAGVATGAKRCIDCHLPHGSTNRRLQVLSEEEMAGITMAVTPASTTVPRGSSVSFAAAAAGMPVDRHVEPHWTVTPTGGGSAGVTYTSTDGPIAVPDPSSFRPDGGIASVLTVADHATILDLDVFVSMSHGRRCDLSVLLEHVDTGRHVLLEDASCWVNGAFGSIWYDQEKRVSGSTRPHEPLDAFYGEDAFGTWRLHVVDHFPGNTGTLTSFTLSVNAGVVGVVDGAGLFRAVAPGTAVVRASVHSGRIRPTYLCGGLWWDLTETEAAATASVTVTAP